MISWTNKFNKIQSPKIRILEKRFGEILTGEKMLISTPVDIFKYINRIPRGHFVSIKRLRRELAYESNADGTCHLTTSIFLRIAIEYSLESNNYLPFWRVIDPKSNLARKLSCGLQFIEDMQKEELLA
mgnify:CR=1 FL=1|tara:strand:- start:952 stop:1335 length:384 start_codon:yes stop_codon:yes gene_type:complete